MHADRSSPHVPRRRHAASVRTRIVAAITAVMALGLIVVGVSVYVVERQRIMAQVDERLKANLESARFIVDLGDQEAGPWASSSDALEAVVQRMSPDDNTGAFGMVNGEITFVPGIELDLDLQDHKAFARFADAQLADGEPVIGTYAEDDLGWRYLATPIAIEGSPEPTEVIFVMVYDLHAELAEINDAAQMFLIASLIATLLVAATGTIVATRLLRPLRDMRETANRISAQSLDERLPIVGNDDVAELADTMNAMLDRIDSAVDSQRQLLSDVGHELKTPITIVRGHLELMNPADPTDARDTQLLVVDELDRMARLVQDLSSAASLHGSSPLTTVPVDAGTLVHQIARKATGIDGAEIVVGAVAPGTVVLDPERITQAVLQLAQNAVTHGGGRIELTSHLDAEYFSIHIRDFGQGVPEHMKDEIFQRFTRGHDTQGRAGSGLGLHIVQVIARAHGGTSSVRDADGGGAEFVVKIPRGSSAGGVPGLTGLVIPPRPPLPTPPAASNIRKEG